jgi:hypothetical protein
MIWTLGVYFKRCHHGEQAVRLEERLLRGRTWCLAVPRPVKRNLIPSLNTSECPLVQRFYHEFLQTSTVSQNPALSLW